MREINCGLFHCAIYYCMMQFTTKFRMHILRETRFSIYEFDCCGRVIVCYCSYKWIGIIYNVGIIASTISRDEIPAG